ncbi:MULTISPECIES: hypothetical protein [unclassified Mesorhizobium]|uniref:hypothetical protein n=3 Tax=Mesorhizobium TaxID=68287 RepID=UPI00109227F8|nr:MULTISPECIES: hypothetical protein [unclassified Mesorhizobium]TGQ43688.1 hypothetical protein EN857_06245 [Mesorhizobium sp. M4B.F.Ca.ET.214.01.1.1]TGQ62503.1 hypothetical protein EN854_06250 [Mesorhizobium sp. M4B.F.Ca.ET.211.01.1.1]TGU39705.1 hypothetical protein EN793_06245 [Mesorhizobium sp. M4B.F.Ca.ET.150.01.1.1]
MDVKRLLAPSLLAAVLGIEPVAASSTSSFIDVLSGGSSSKMDLVAQSESDEQVVPGISPVFLAKLSAITEDASPTDKKLSDIDSLVRSYGWPSTPPAIAQVVAAARVKILAQKTKPADLIVGEIPCEDVTIDFNSKQQWYPGGTPFGIPFEQWTVSSFNALKARISECGNPDGQGLISYLDYSVGNPMAEREADSDRTKELLDELAAIVRDQKNPTQRLAAIDDFLRRLKWAAPPEVEREIERAMAVAQVEERATESAQSQATRQREEATIKIDDAALQEAQEVTIFRQFSTKYYVANYCAEHDAFFTAEEVERLRAELQSTFAAMHLSQEKRDAAWNHIQATAPAQLAGVADEDCASEKRAYALIWPQVFAPTSPVENPF